MKSFDDLAGDRRGLRAFCASHFASVMYFSAGISFYLNEQERPIRPGDLRHITSSVTCYESLLACPSAFRDREVPNARIHKVVTSPELDGLALEEKIQRFADGILAMATDDWISDASARVYCECRALPFAVRKATRWKNSIRKHIEHALKQLALDPSRPAIGEADPNVDTENWYPPNAYHTFWILKALVEVRTKFPREYESLDRKIGITTKIDRMHQWARQTLASQAALHASESSTRDTDQLAWSLAIVCGDPKLSLTRLAEQDFLRECLRCLFTTQTNIGTWTHYAPLFHYQKSGNAYCYVFETFAALLESSLRPGARFLREAWKSHCEGLLRLYSYARATQRSGPTDGHIILWSSVSIRATTRLTELAWN